MDFYISIIQFMLIACPTILGLGWLIYIIGYMMIKGFKNGSDIEPASTTQSVAHKWYSRLFRRMF